MAIYDYDNETYNIWHMMIDEKYQNNDIELWQELCIDYIKSKPFGKSNDIILTCNMKTFMQLIFIKN